MVIFPLAPDQTIAQMWSNGARGGMGVVTASDISLCILLISGKKKIKIKIGKAGRNELPDCNF